MTNLNQPSTKPSRLRGLNISLALVVILSFLGFADASYLTADHYLSLPLPCTLNGCEVVLTSRYATLGPVPTALLAVLLIDTIFGRVYPNLGQSPHDYTANNIGDNNHRAHNLRLLGLPTVFGDTFAVHVLSWVGINNAPVVHIEHFIVQTIEGGSGKP